MHTKDTIQQAKEFHKILSSNHLEDLQRLISFAKQLHQIYTDDCNGTMSKSQGIRMEQLKTKIEFIAASMGVRVKFNPDPRGYPVKILHPSGAFNTIGGATEGWGVG